MNKFLEQALLFDFYGELLTDHQKEIYEQFALEDLSLSEIAEMIGSENDTEDAGPVPCPDGTGGTSVCGCDESRRHRFVESTGRVWKWQ